MGKLEDALRDLIQYHGRRAAREVQDDLPERVREIRREVRDLSNAVEELRKDVSELLEARRERMAVRPAPEEEVQGARITRRTSESIRKKFDLTQGELAQLLEVSPGSVTAWETGRTRPRGENAAKIITLRDMDRAEVDKALGREGLPTTIQPDDIKQLRERLDLTQAQLAQLLEVAPGTVTHWETGRSEPGRSNVEAIAELQAKAQEEVEAALGETADVSRLEPEQIKDLRGRFDLTQEELAKLVGVTAGAVSNWEAGRSQPTAANRHAIFELRNQEQDEIDAKLGRQPKASGTEGAEGDAELGPEDLKRIRKSVGLSQKELAKELDVSVGSVSNWERGAVRPRGENLRRIRALATKPNKPQNQQKNQDQEANASTLASLYSALG